jgi:hypothetical protein
MECGEKGRRWLHGEIAHTAAGHYVAHYLGAVIRKLTMRQTFMNWQAGLEASIAPSL